MNRSKASRRERRRIAQAGVPKERSLLFGVEFGGGESKDLRLHFGISEWNFGDWTLGNL